MPWINREDRLMQQFFIDYGLWLLVALLILIGVVFLLTGRKKTVGAPVVERPAEVERRDIAPPPPIRENIAAEPIAAPVADAEPRIMPAAVESAPASSSMSSDEPDNLLKLKGVGPKLNLLLIELGVTRYAQIASWSDADIAAIDAKLGNFKGRPVRDQWVDQARYLAAGDLAGYEAKYGKL
jgi:predicted flap endonuclease-1-like 5' DNA nuclease